MSAFHGAYNAVPGAVSGKNKGIRRRHKRIKREDAIARNEHTAPERRKRWRKGKR